MTAILSRIRFNVRQIAVMVVSLFGRADAPRRFPTETEFLLSLSFLQPKIPDSISRTVISFFIVHISCSFTVCIAVCHSLQVDVILIFITKLYARKDIFLKASPAIEKR